MYSVMNKKQIRWLEFTGHSELAKSELKNLLVNDNEPPARTWNNLTKDEVEVFTRSRNIQVKRMSTIQLIKAMSQSQREVRIEANLPTSFMLM